MKTGKRIEGGDKGGWEIKWVNFQHVSAMLTSRVNNGGLNMTSSIETMPFIAMEPIGSTPTVSFDMHIGTVPGGIPDEEPWVYQRADRPTYEQDDMWALPTSEPQAIASSSNTSGVFCKDQILPLTFHVLDAQEQKSTVRIITVCLFSTIARTSIKLTCSVLEEEL